MPNNSTPLKVVNKYTQKWVAEYIYTYVFFSSWKNLKWSHSVTKNLEQFGDDFVGDILRACENLCLKMNVY